MSKVITFCVTLFCGVTHIRRLALTVTGRHSNNDSKLSIGFQYTCLGKKIVVTVKYCVLRCRFDLSSLLLFPLSMS